MRFHPLRTWFPTVVLLAILVASCQREEPPAAQTAALTPAAGGTLRLTLEHPRSLDPALTDDVYQATVINQLFSGLLRHDADLNVLPDLAMSWTVSRDGLIYIFELRRDARFHDGSPVLAKDVVYSLTRLFDDRRVEPGIIQDYLHILEGADDFAARRSPRITGLEIEDPHTVRMRLVQPYPSFLAVLCMDQAKIVPAARVETAGDLTFGLDPVGSGPFRFAGWNAEDRLVLVSNPDYFGAPAFLDSVIVCHHTGDDGSRERAEFLAGELDLHEVREAGRRELQRRGSYRFIRRAELSMEFMGLNVRRPPFDDPRVCRAVAHALDREALSRVAGEGLLTPAGILPPGMLGYSPDSKLLPHDPERARALLAEAGFTELRPLEFEIATSSRSRHALSRDSVIVASLARAGIRARMRNFDWLELNEAIDNETADAFQITWIADLPDPDSFLYTLLASRGMYNLLGYANPDVDRLLAQGRAETHPTRRLDHYREAERLILADSPLVPLFNVTIVYAFQPELRGMEMSPFGVCSIPLNKLWFAPPSEELHAAR